MKNDFAKPTCVKYGLKMLSDFTSIKRIIYDLKIKTTSLELRRVTGYLIKSDARRQNILHLIRFYLLKKKIKD
jgi:hypothetical protein